MSKSTPLSQLRNRKPQVEEFQNPQQEENENELVNEILKEIDQEEQQLPPEPMPEYQDNYQPMPPQYAQPQPQPQPQYIPQEAPEEPESKSLFDQLKTHLIVGLIVLVMSHPKITSLIGMLLPKRDLIQNNIVYIVLLVKGLIGALVSFAIENFM